MIGTPPPSCRPDPRRTSGTWGNPIGVVARETIEVTDERTKSVITKLTLATGALLTLTGLIAYATTGGVSLTAMIPSAVGILMLIAGGLAYTPSLHRHAIHAALVVALVGALGSLMNVVKIGQLFAGTAERPGAIWASLVMFVALVVYLAFGVRSFIDARRARQA